MGGKNNQKLQVLLFVQTLLLVANQGDHADALLGQIQGHGHDRVREPMGKKAELKEDCCRVN